jgi:hypothetical protein
MDFLYSYEISEQWNLLQLLEVRQGGDLRGRDGGSEITKYNISLFGIVTMNPPCTMNI